MQDMQQNESVVQDDVSSNELVNNETVNDIDNGEMPDNSDNADDVIDNDVDGSDDDANDAEPMPGYMKKHFRKLEKKIKRENRELNYKLEAASEELQQYRSLFNATYAQAAQPIASEGDEIETKIANILSTQEKRKLQEQQSIQAARSAQRLYQDFKSNLDKASDKYDDFEDVVYDDKNPITSTIANTVQYLPNAGDVLYALSKNKAELKRIGNLPEAEQVKEVAAYAIKLAAGGSNKISKAPKPVSTNVRSSPAKSNDPSKMSVSELKQFLKNKTHRKG